MTKVGNGTGATLDDTSHHPRHGSIETTRIDAKWNNERLKDVLRER